MFFLPIRDHNPSGHLAFVTWALIAANVAIFLGTLPVMQDAETGLRFVSTYGLVPAEATLVSAITSTFLHGSFLHLAGNMLFLWIYGDNMEEELGHLGFAAFYLTTGVVAGYAHVLADPSSPVPLIGASGAVAGVMGAYLLFFPKARIDVLFVLLIFFRIIPVRAWVVLGLWFGSQVLYGSATASEGAGVAYWAHVGGFVAGVLLVLPIFIKRGGSRYWERNEGHPPHPDAVYRRTSIPTVRARRR